MSTFLELKSFYKHINRAPESGESGVGHFNIFRVEDLIANMLFAVELQRRIDAAGGQVISVAAQPGANKTNLSRFMTEAEYNAAVDRIGELMDPWQGALSVRL